MEKRTVLELDAAGVASIIWCTGFTGDFSWCTCPCWMIQGSPSTTVAPPLCQTLSGFDISAKLAARIRRAINGEVC